MIDTTHDFKAHEYLKNEKIQIFLRLGFVTIAAISIYFFYYQSAKGYEYSLNVVMFAPLCVFIANLIYLFIVKNFPYRLQTQRIVVAVVFDIAFTVYVMYMVNDLAAYYPGVLLWFSVGYGMRYNKKIAYTAYTLIIISWVLLIFLSDFWIEHRNFGIGWLLAYIVLPLYYFKLVEKLHKNLENLNNYANESTHRAMHDQLTGLSNRAQFEEDLREYIQINEKKSTKFALFFIDLDSFKEINDKFGHDVGDSVLIETARRLEEVFDKSYRLGGDEFVSLVPYKDDSELEEEAKTLMSHLTQPCQKYNIIFSASIGIARFPNDARRAFDIKKRADLAMYAAKNAGKNRYYFYYDIV
jgi:diguanylate cyclase (GGDEF)-like protein